MDKSTKIMACGTFDLLHEGHKNFLQQAKAHGNFLIVVVARDRNVLRIKGKIPHDDEELRLKNVQNIPFVDKARLGNENDLLKTVEEEQPDIICLGYDQQVDEEKLAAALAARGLAPIIMRLKSYKPETYKTTLLAQLPVK